MTKARRKAAAPRRKKPGAKAVGAAFSEINRVARFEAGKPWFVETTSEEPLDELLRERDRLRDRLDQFEAYGMPNVAAALEKIDPWRHRSARMSCATCMWFVEKSVPQGRQRISSIDREKRAVTFEESQRFGRCRRHAPTMSGYPAVYGSDWCGDHKLDEAKA